eukprot:CAMPEP_0179084940 /NCGR_PEP_ID=MMETSP0796-20121207/38439_1 /TAXON_ID=73915 /ORGANISM="Pyrodinium bahamense, Strain pbaha01" /LENGTH=509 /DNA_ID=CAMNT_0020782367 /DNA_START=61 /DNA_END=1590 /DNA_ORIENTATION=-
MVACHACLFYLVAGLMPHAAQSKSARQPTTLGPPSTYATVRNNFNGNKGTSQTIDAKGPSFSAYVYMQVPYETAYDKRVIFAAYVQSMPKSCPWPNACDGQKGGDEFDMIETGFVGFNDTWAKNDNLNCGECSGVKCWSYGGPGCKTPGTACLTGDDKHCNGYPDKQSCPRDCTWSDAQRCISYCTQTVELNPRYQDNTKFAANAFLGGQTGKQYWYYKCGSGTTVENDQNSYSVATPGGKWGNRWIKLDLKLVRNQAWYTWTFFHPGPVSDTSVAVAGVQSLMVEHHDKSWNTFSGGRHVWVFSIWQYVFKSARPQNDEGIPGGVRQLHYLVCNSTEHCGHDEAYSRTPAPLPPPKHGEPHEEPHEQPHEESHEVAAQQGEPPEVPHEEAHKGHTEAQHSREDNGKRGRGNDFEEDNKKNGNRKDSDVMGMALKVLGMESREKGDGTLTDSLSAAAKEQVAYGGVSLFLLCLAATMVLSVRRSRSLRRESHALIPSDDSEDSQLQRSL